MKMKQGCAEGRGLMIMLGILAKYGSPHSTLDNKYLLVGGRSREDKVKCTITRPVHHGPVAYSKIKRPPKMSLKFARRRELSVWWYVVCANTIFLFLGYHY